MDIINNLVLLKSTLRKDLVDVLTPENVALEQNMNVTLKFEYVAVDTRKPSLGPVDRLTNLTYPYFSGYHLSDVSSINLSE